MPSQDFDASGVPTDLADALNLTTGKHYYVTNVDAIASLRWRDADAQPSASARGHIIPSNSSVVLRVESTTKLWLWTDDGSCACVVTEAIPG